MTVTMNRPDHLNAMTWDMHEESSRIFYDLGMDHRSTWSSSPARARPSRPAATSSA